MVEASRDEASLAVRLYNDATDIRSFEGFVVHLHLAWLYLLHSEFTRDNIDYRYWKRDNPRRLERIDGEPKQWELARSVRERWPDSRNPVRANLDFFIGLRNKVEHRFARDHAALAAAVSGQAQAMLLNYEKELTDQFGIASSLATRLRFPVFIGSFTGEGEKALLQLRKRLPASLRKFLAEYHTKLGSAITDDARYELRLRVLQELAPRDRTLAIQFTRYNDLTDEERDTVEQLGRKGHVIIRERLRNVAGADELSPKQVVQPCRLGCHTASPPTTSSAPGRHSACVQRPGRRIQSARTKGTAPTTPGTGTTAIARRTSRSSYGSAPRPPASRD